ncbi:hypothetical protein NWO25_19645 [Enterococcus lactis]|nr:hypothetical protein [Enterococcus lactis]
MDKYINMKNPPRFSGNGSFSPFFFRSINAWWLLFWAKIVNNLVHLPLFFALLNYGLWIAIALVIVWRPYNNPGQRQIFAIIESIFLRTRTITMP